MGIRETLNQNPKATAAVTAGLVLIAVAVIVYQLMQPSGPQAASGNAWYTTDGGQTYYSDDGGKIPPFERDGKTAVRAYVWQCGGDPFVSHLERLAPDSKKKLEELQAKGVNVNPGPRKPGDPPGNVAVMTLMNDKEVRAPGPGDDGWVKMLSPEGRAIGSAKCPDGQDGPLVAVMP